MKFNNPFKKKRLRTLGDLDENSLETVDKILSESLSSPMPKLDEILENYKLCPKCQSDLFVLNPKITMGELILCECSVCKERIYKNKELIK
jgi:hypothetical protein